MIRLWVILRKKQKIWRDIVVEAAGDDLSNAKEAVAAAAYELDVPRPLWLPKNERDLEQFGRVQFIGDNFIEAIDFDRMEAEFLYDKPKAIGPDDSYALS